MAKSPGHFTEAGTRKYQANGPQAWSAQFRRLAAALGSDVEGVGIRVALAYGAAHATEVAAWAKGGGMAGLAEVGRLLPAAMVQAAERAKAKGGGKGKRKGKQLVLGLGKGKGEGRAARRKGKVEAKAEAKAGGEGAE